MADVHPIAPKKGWTVRLASFSHHVYDLEKRLAYQARPAPVGKIELAVGILTAYTGLIVMSVIVIHQFCNVHESAGAPRSSIVRGQIGSQA